MPSDKWDIPDGERPDQQPDWHEVFGDRKQMLVFIGQEMDEEKIRARLDACLLDEESANGGIESWNQFDNPFPPLEPAVEASAESEQ